MLVHLPVELSWYSLNVDCHSVHLWCFCIYVKMFYICGEQTYYIKCFRLVVFSFSTLICVKLCAMAKISVTTENVSIGENVLLQNFFYRNFNLSNGLEVEFLTNARGSTDIIYTYFSYIIALHTLLDVSYFVVRRIFITNWDYYCSAAVTFERKIDTIGNLSRFLYDCLQKFSRDLFLDHSHMYPLPNVSVLLRPNIVLSVVWRLII